MAESASPSIGGHHSSVIRDARVPPPAPSLSPTKETLALTIEKQRQKRVRIYRPAENSLYDLMYQNQRVSLFVRPIFWTSQHLQLLGVRFDQLPACDTPVPSEIAEGPPSKGHMQPSPAIKTLSDSLSEITAPADWHTAPDNCPVREVLSILWPQPFKNTSSQLEPQFHLQFGRSLYHNIVQARLIWGYPAGGTPISPYNLRSSIPSPALDPTGLPMMCYICKKQLAALRMNPFQVVPGPKGSINGPVSRLQRARARISTPSNTDEDPYLVGILLAMAQQHFFNNGTTIRQRTSPPRSSGFQNVKLRILMDDAEKELFLVYTSTVTQTFIDRFIEPLSTPARDCADGAGGIPGMKIEYAKVPYWPILGLRERLGKALGEDIVGPFNPNDVETWVDEEPPSMDRGAKRKSEALNKASNGSFKSNIDSLDEPPIVGKKRCLSQGLPVGMIA